MPTTIYDIKLRYTLDDKASKGVQKIERASTGAARATSGLSSSLGRMGAVVVGAFGVRQAAGALIGFNSTVEDTKLQIGGMLALAKKTDLSDELKRADRLYANLQRRAMSLPGTTQEYVTMAGNITQPIIDAGLSMRDLEDLTVNATVAAKALREERTSARDIDQALRGQFHATDPFAGKVLGAIGYKGEEGRERYNALSGNERASELKRALMLKQWGQLAAAQGQTFSGIMSTIQDRFQQVIGKVGLPLFKAIGEELRSWNDYIAANQSKVDEIARSVGQGLVDGFRAVKDAVVFLVDHRDTLIMLGKIWLASKAGGMIGGMVGGGAGMLGMLRQNVGGKGGLGAGGAAGPLGAAFGAGYLLGDAIMDNTSLAHDLGNVWRRMTGTYDASADVMEKRFQEINRSMKAMDNAVNAAADRLRNGGGAGSTGTGIQLAGGADYLANQLSLLKDVQAGKGNIMGAMKSQFYDASLFANLQNAPGKAGLLNSLHPDRAGGQTDLDRVVAELEAKFNRREGVRMSAPGAVDSMLGNNMSLLTDYQRQTVDYAAAQEKLMQLVVRALTTGGTVTGQQVLDILRAASEDPTGTRKKDKMKNPGKVNVTIQRIEVKSEDPDRFAFNLVEALRDARRSPSSTSRAIRGG